MLRCSLILFLLIASFWHDRALGAARAPGAAYAEPHENEMEAEEERALIELEQLQNIFEVEESLNESDTTVATELAYLENLYPENQMTTATDKCSPSAEITQINQENDEFWEQFNINLKAIKNHNSIQTFLFLTITSIPGRRFNLPQLDQNQIGWCISNIRYNKNNHSSELKSITNLIGIKNKNIPKQTVKRVLHTINQQQTPFFSTEEIHQTFNNFHYLWHDHIAFKSRIFIPDYTKSPYYKHDRRFLNGSYIRFQFGDAIPYDLNPHHEMFHEIAWMFFGCKGYLDGFYIQDIEDIKMELFLRYGCTEKNYMHPYQHCYEQVARSILNEHYREKTGEILPLKPYMESVDLDDIGNFVLK